MNKGRQDSRDRMMRGLNWTQIGVILAGLGVMSTLHASYVIPAMMQEASELIDKKIRAHEGHVHPDAVSHKELSLSLGAIQVKMDSIEKAVNRLTERMDQK